MAHFITAQILNLVVPKNQICNCTSMDLLHIQINHYWQLLLFLNFYKITYCVQNVIFYHLHDSFMKVAQAKPRNIGRICSKASLSTSYLLTQKLPRDKTNTLVSQFQQKQLQIAECYLSEKLNFNNKTDNMNSYKQEKLFQLSSRLLVPL